MRVGQETVHESWCQMLEREAREPYFAALQRAVQADRLQGPVYPPRGMVLAALRTPLRAIRCVILGQDPYHGPGQAHGLAFSVPDGVRPPPSLHVVFSELEAEQFAGRKVACGKVWYGRFSGNLSPWTRQGVLLLNTVLTVKGGHPKSHAGQGSKQPGVGWEEFTDAVCREVLGQDRPVAWLLWGADARKKLDNLVGCALSQDSRVALGGHLLLCAPHPSPANLSASFRGSRPFSQCNDWLQTHGAAVIDWSLATPDEVAAPGAGRS